MKRYDYIPVHLITEYSDWNLEYVFPARKKGEEDYVLVSKAEDKPKEYQPNLKESSTEELLAELKRRLEVTNVKDKG